MNVELRLGLAVRISLSPCCQTTFTHISLYLSISYVPIDLYIFMLIFSRQTSQEQLTAERAKSAELAQRLAAAEARAAEAVKQLREKDAELV